MRWEGGIKRLSLKPSMSLFLNCESVIIDATAEVTSLPFSQQELGL